MDAQGSAIATARAMVQAGARHGWLRKRLGGGGGGGGGVGGGGCEYEVMEWLAPSPLL